MIIMILNEFIKKRTDYPQCTVFTVDKTVLGVKKSSSKASNNAVITCG